MTDSGRDNGVDSGEHCANEDEPREGVAALRCDSVRQAVGVGRSVGRSGTDGRDDRTSESREFERKGRKEGGGEGGSSAALPAEGDT